MVGFLGQNSLDPITLTGDKLSNGTLAGKTRRVDVEATVGLDGEADSARTGAVVNGVVRHRLIISLTWVWERGNCVV